MSLYMPLLYAGFGMLGAIFCAWVGWTARDKLGAARSEPSVQVRSRHGGWEEPAVGEEIE